MAQTILNIDDSEDDQVLLQFAWKKCASPLALRLVGDGDRAVEYLRGSGAYADRESFPLPALILLDLKMPRKTGFEVLEWMAQELPAEGRPPVAVFTSSQDTADVRRAYALGARWYLVKPVQHSELVSLVQTLGLWCGDPDRNDLAASPLCRPRR